MSRIAPIVPAETDMLCEGCGYTLNGLPTGARCPECGKPLAESVHASRSAPSWEQQEFSRPFSFVSTTGSVIFRTTEFYRTLTTRSDTRPAVNFARLHWLIASILFAITASIHLRSMGGFSFNSGWPYPLWLESLICAGFVLVTYGSLSGITWLAARLTNWEATYRGLRLPTPVVLRGMYYHAAHYLPVALMAFLTVAIYHRLLIAGIFTYRSIVPYLYVVGGEVILGAVYLFQTYWIGMRNMMYANR